ncbi:dihydroorotate dehydrogenase electron transfer subunit [Nocardioides sp. Y6]|uniref:Dihydroorotate dehydrogenase electron transfer subunit n=1 Tax=Nocardioides malaquae TaxID=2773426 RepID=A0ABR9RNE0_9ACTN|nr:dihydroorotate dehydrogenase electron transfer subunit [Nocardioides malaquae]MBE7323079.1 dihydroorotate dehydrogenase electron transfer subunit [Nocardioides malaquae]
MPRHVRGEVLAVRRAGAHRVVSLAAPGVPATFRPGTFVKVSESGRHDEGWGGSGAWWIHRVEPTSAFGPTVEVLVDPEEADAAWLLGLAVGRSVRVTGALGRPFTLPREPVPVLLVGEGGNASPLVELADRLRQRGCAVTLLLGAPDEQHLFAVREARRLARHLHVRTHDGSVGERGHVADAVGPLLAASQAAVLYTAGVPDACRPVVEAADAAGVPAQVALRVPMPCGTGLCHGCVLPVLTPGDAVRQVRACVEGPVLPGHRVAWDQLVATDAGVAP